MRCVGEGTSGIPSPAFHLDLGDHQCEITLAVDLRS